MFDLVNYIGVVSGGRHYNFVADHSELSEFYHRRESFKFYCRDRALLW